MTLSADKAAALLVDVRRNRSLLPALPEDLRPHNLAEAYAIQRACIEPLLSFAGGGSIIGRKCGATNDTAMANFGLAEPFHGQLLSAYAHRSPARLSGQSMFMRVIECEYAFRMGEDLPAAAAPYDPDAVCAAVKSVMPAIEIVDSRYQDWTKVGGLQVIADAAGTGHWVYGQETSDLDCVDYEAQPVTLTFDGAEIHVGSGAAVLGNPWHSLTWLVNSLAAAGEALKADEIVTTGSCNPPTPAPAKVQIKADFGALGSVDLHFD